MVKYRIHDWKKIEAKFTDRLLLGNGASRAIWPKFKYDSLYKEALTGNRIDSSLADLFSALGTKDFEFVLRRLSQTSQVNQHLGIDEDKTSTLYEALRNALIDTVRAIHPEHQEVNRHLIWMAEFMMRFNTVLCLNYDLLVYWAMLEGNDKHKNRLKDCFIQEGSFENDYGFLRRRYDAEDATLVFYPHGSLILATTPLDHEIKVSRVVDDERLLSRIIDTWWEQEFIPLFVSEGETSKKLEAIRRSNYLKTVYDREVDTKADSLVIYGWSFGDQDEHILRGIIHGGIGRMAIAVRTGSDRSQSFCRTTECRIRDMEEMIRKEEEVRQRRWQKPRKRAECEIVFFDAESDGVWNNRAPDAVGRKG